MLYTKPMERLNKLAKKVKDQNSKIHLMETENGDIIVVDGNSMLAMRINSAINEANITASMFLKMVSEN